MITEMTVEVKLSMFVHCLQFEISVCVFASLSQSQTMKSASNLALGLENF